LMPIKMAKHAKANVASNALRECLLEEKELIFYIYVSFFLMSCGVLRRNSSFENSRSRKISLRLRSLFPKTIIMIIKKNKNEKKGETQKQNNNNNKIKTRKEEREKSTCFCSTAGPRSLSSPLLFRVIAVRLPILVIIIIFITLNEEEEDTEEEEEEECIRPRHRRR